LHSPRPFKNPNYTKNINRRAKNLKTVLAQERERERLERERKRAEREEMKMDVDGDGETKRDLDAEDEVPTCSSFMMMCCSAADILCRYHCRSPSICLATETLL
jgi:INO80 complex subunit C